MAEPTAGSDDGLTVCSVGVQRVGSTWLMRLLRQNLEAEPLVVNQTHVPIPPDHSDAYFVLMRDPWAWLASFYEFQLHPVFGVVDKVWNKILHPPVDDWRAARWWNTYLLSYERWETDLPEDRTVFLHYRDLLPDPNPVLGEAIDELGLQCRDPVRNERTYTKDFSSPLAKIFTPESLPSRSFYPTYYN
jgi:hypothetical protein